jgi:4-hydroxymandelate oxidase
MPGSFLLVDRNLIEAVALLAFAVLPPESLWGLDRLRLVRKSPPESKEEEQPPSDRRELLADLVSVPVLGTFVVALLASRKMKGMIAGDRDVFVAGATPPAGDGTLPASSNLVGLCDFEKAAHAKMSVAAWEFVDSGAGDDQTARWNNGAYHRIYLEERALVDVSKIDTSIRLLGRARPHPIMLSPVSNHNYVHPDAERATARGAGAAGATMILSTFAYESIEAVAKSATMPLWHATYMMKDRSKTLDMLQRAAAAGYEAICVPVDTPVIGARDRELRTYRFKTKPLSFQDYPINYYRYPTTWADIEWYLSQTRLPLLLKGIMHPEDADRGIRMGVSGIFVSNHGGRNLDTTSATIDVLPRVVDKVAGRVPVIVDGGIRRGTDVLKALAFGATAVSIGRPYIYGLAVKGPEGVTGVINILRNELEMAMANTGRPNIASIDRTVIAARG